MDPGYWIARIARLGQPSLTACVTPGIRLPLQSRHYISSRIIEAGLYVAKSAMSVSVALSKWTGRDCRKPRRAVARIKRKYWYRRMENNWSLEYWKKHRQVSMVICKLDGGHWQSWIRHTVVTFFRVSTFWPPLGSTWSGCKYRVWLTLANLHSILTQGCCPIWLFHPVPPSWSWTCSYNHCNFHGVIVRTKFESPL